ncbi:MULTISPECIES: hypothetical protein [unclassified Imperialibacter]|uniref:hypothetical protein n=1 Tax=unclassified Imperialibacter TaxID=2629706 RepID=UPI001256B01F|nr:MULTISPECIES: hypothetical protein [unclassified Imperialibacter]CAD5266993.1 conserved hypothetical protein [Imperialibacter sp. 89]CAD5282209.1 conserved hypothetical protein [Imperialibacter sp. 75]VVT17309.1 hypothetical protein IMPR6_250085 [Imperialibacter sp. EC-SDR9]
MSSSEIANPLNPINGPQRWKKYVFEFVLLFLAVFFGFLADNLREEYFERQQANELAKSFYEELKNDSVTVVAKVAGRIKKEQAIEYMVRFFKDSALTSTSKDLSINFLWATTVRTPVIFTPRTVVLEQLKSSGSLRYFKSRELQKLVGDLSVAIDYLMERQALEASVYHEYIEPIMINHMDYDFQYQLLSNGIFDRMAEYENSDEYIPFHLSQPEKIDRLDITNALGYYHTNNLKSTRMIPFNTYMDVNAAILLALRKEYSLK